MTRTTAARRGATLVELLVAAALCILGMWLLTWVYQQGMESFRTSRAQADLTAQQRMVVTLLTRDLKADHFLDEDTKPNRGRRLSDQRTDLLTSNGYTPPRGGYFRAGSFAAPTTPNDFPPYAPNVNVLEGTGTDNINSSRSVNHFLQFTVLLPGGSDSQTFSAEVPPAGGSRAQYFSTAAEVTYYLRPAGQTAGGIPLFDLYRQQRISVPNDDYLIPYMAPAADPSSPEVMTSFAGKMKTFVDLTVPQGYATSVRLPGPVFTPIGVAQPSARLGEDKLMTNVLSFEIKFTGVPGIGVNGGPVANWPTPYIQGNSDFPYDNLPFDGMFDTHSPQLTLTPPWNQDIASAANPGRRLKPIRITGMQCRVRTWDSRTKSTRQTTFVVDL